MGAIDVGKALAADYPFIEISLEDDITTIVGGNESGKSHLLSAIRGNRKGDTLIFRRPARPYRLPRRYLLTAERDSRGWRASVIRPGRR